MEEIANQSSQLEAYLKVHEIETKKKKVAIEEENKRKQDEINRAQSEANEYQIQLENQIIEREDTIRKAIVHDLVEEAQASGNPLSPTIVKFLQHFKRKE